MEKSKHKKALKPGIGWAWSNGIRISNWAEPNKDKYIYEVGQNHIQDIRVAIVPLADYRRIVKELRELRKNTNDAAQRYIKDIAEMQKNYVMTKTDAEYFARERTAVLVPLKPEQMRRLPERKKIR